VVVLLSLKKKEKEGVDEKKGQSDKRKEKECG
jgi:hypothetical protein